MTGLSDDHGGRWSVGQIAPSGTSHLPNELQAAELADGTSVDISDDK